MKGVLHPWAMTLESGARHHMMAIAGYCVGEFGGRSPIGRAVRQAIFSPAVRRRDEDIEAAEWLVWCDRIVGAMPVLPYRALIALYTMAAIFERSLPPDTEAAGWESLGAQRECWAALRRGIDEHQSSLPAGCVVAEIRPGEDPGDAADNPLDDEDINEVINAITIMVRSVGADPGGGTGGVCNCPACRAARAATGAAGGEPMPGMTATIRAMAEADAAAAEAEARFRVKAEADAAVAFIVTKPPGPAGEAGPGGPGPVADAG
jgi:hypothetical protein